MTNKPLLHPHSTEQLAALQNRPPHALLIGGPSGIGKATVARWLAANLLQCEPDNLANHPYTLQIESEAGKAIGIEAIRELEHFTALRVPDKRSINRLVIIHDAHMLTTEAQNALLKTLEEPPLDTMIILTSSQSAALLPTIRSRLQLLELLRPTAEALHDRLLHYGVPNAEIPGFLALSGGLPGLAFTLAGGDEEQPLVVAARLARQLLQQAAFERLRDVDSLVKNRVLAQNVIHILMQLAHAALLTGKASARWQKVLTAAYAADESIGQGAQLKLVLTNLMLNL